jgi:Protein of unknown function (DUF551)
MTDLNRLADLILPGIKNAQLKLEEVSNYLGAMPYSLRHYDGWQPIETAPKIDGKRILVVWLGNVQIASWNAKVGKWQEDWSGDFTVDDDEVTHWMLLPEPPK